MAYFANEILNPKYNSQQKKENIVAHLRDELQDLQHKENEYKEQVSKHREIELKADVLKDEKAGLEDKKRHILKENERFLNGLQGRLESVIKITDSKENEYQKLLVDKKNIDNQIEQRTKQNESLRKDIEKLKQSSNLSSERFNELKTNITKKEKENDDVNRKIDELDYQHKSSQKELSLAQEDTIMLEKEINELEDKIKEATKEKDTAKQEYDSNKLKINENNQMIGSLESQIVNLEKELRHTRNLNDKYDKDIGSYEKTYVNQSKKNDDLDKELEQNEKELHLKTGELDDLEREISKMQNGYTIVDDENKNLEKEIDHYKESVRGLSLQNDELMLELDKIIGQDESIKNIINRKSRLDHQIEKAETQIIKNQFREDLCETSNPSI